MCFVPWSFGLVTTMARTATLLCAFVANARPAAVGEDLVRLSYDHEGLTVDLGVGLWVWPLPMDYDNDGDLDLLAACPDTPYNGVYFFENASPGEKMPVFKPAVRLGAARPNMRVSTVAGQPRVLIPAHEFVDFRHRGFDDPLRIHPVENVHDRAVRANTWSLVDFDGDGLHDLIVGVGDWTGYGWDNAYDARGQWQNDRLHGYVYVLRNEGTKDGPKYGSPVRVQAGGADLDVYGWPCPNFADFDGDGDLDLICGEFLDQFSYFENTGSRSVPRYVAGRRLTHAGRPVCMDLQMITPTAIDWDSDGDQDLIVGQEDGRIALVEHRGRIIAGRPQFLPPVFFQQQAAELKFGALSTPVGCDWDGDGDLDIVSGNTAGYVGWFENLDGAPSPRWAAPRLIHAAGRPIRIQAGTNGSIQGPCEAKWGYTAPSVADWDGDGLADLLVNSIWGEVLWYRNLGPPEDPQLEGARPIQVAWQQRAAKPKWNWWDPGGNQLVTQWRTTPVAVDFTANGLVDLVMLDHEGYLALYERTRQADALILLPPKRALVDARGRPLRFNPRTAGRSGRRKFAVADWDGDDRLDILVNSANADWWRNCGTVDGKIRLMPMGPLGQKRLAAHSTSPAVVDWDGNGQPDLLLGAEDGHFYHLLHDDAVAYDVASANQDSDQPTEPKRPVPEPSLVRREFVFQKAPFAECHASTIAETSSGFVVAWFGGTEEGDPDVGIWISRFDGAEWSPPREVANGAQHSGQRFACWNPVLYQAAAGPLLLFYKVGPNVPEWWGMLTRSHDGGRTWSEPRRLPEGILGPIKNKPIRLPDGRLLCGSSTEHDGWRVHFEITPDLGKSWTRIGPIHDATRFNAIQPCFLQLRDGRLRVLCRSREDRITTAWSHDAGRTWSDMAATDLPNPNSGTDAVTLADGRHLLVYNHTLRGRGSPRNRQMLNVAVSDNGADWKAALVLENQEGEFSYPAVIQADDGSVHITYTWKRQRIKHVVLDPAALELQDMPDGSWPGAK